MADPRPAWAARLDLPADRPIRLGVAAPGVWRRRRRLAALLGGNVRLYWVGHGLGRVLPVDATLGWGAKHRERSERAAPGKPHVAVEDAFLSRTHEPESAVGLLSVAIDPVGIYYDASAPSFLEDLVADCAGLPEVDLAPAVDLMARMRAGNLGKFNAAPDVAEDFPLGRDRPLVIAVDQIAGDLSIAGGGATPETFERMVEAAVEENPDADVALRLHPYDGVDGRTGHLRPLAERFALPVIENDVAWMSLARRASRVYCVTSNAGLEALIAGAEVITFASAFYSHWGLADDRGPAISRRTARPSLPAFVEAAYRRYARYWIPATGAPGDACAFADVLAAARRRAAAKSR